jgi:hypothetical protein
MFFVRQGALLAQSFDMGAGEMVGSEVAVADGVLTSNFGAGVGLSVSASGVVAYRRGQTSRQLAWFDHSGGRIGQAGSDTSNLRWPAISEKGLIALQNTGDAQVWLIDPDKSAPTQLTFSPEGKLTPIWSPDGQWLAFISSGDIRRKRANGSGGEETLVPGPTGFLSDWFQNDILLGSASGDIMMVSLDGKREMRPYLANPVHTETRGVFSPNGPLGRL